MPTLNPRLSITLKPEVSAIFRELSELTGNSQSAMVAELLEDSLPVFEKMAKILRAAKAVKQDARARVMEGIDAAQSHLEQQLGLMLDGIDDIGRPVLEEAERITRRGKPPATAQRRRGQAPAQRSNPPLLTGGSGTDPKGRKATKGRAKRGPRA